MTLQLRLYGLGPTTGRRGHPYHPALTRPCARCRAVAWSPCRGPRGGRRPYCRERLWPAAAHEARIREIQAQAGT